jgi:dienelactone hydrolase
MRPIEILMITALYLGLSCCVFVAVAEDGLHRLLLKIAVAILLVAFLSFLGHVRFEGVHWQLVPTYMSFLPIAGWIWVLRGPKQNWAWPWGLSAVLFLVVSCCLCYAIPMFRLPRPTGQFHVGTCILHMVDRNRIEDTQAGGNRELMVQLWYPAEKISGMGGYRRLACYRRKEETNLVSSYQAVLRTHSYLDAPILRERGQFPVLLFNPAWRGRRTQSTFLTEELASHGYVVAAIDHTYNSMPVAFPDGRVIVAEPIHRFESLVGTYPQEVWQIGNREADKQALDVCFVLHELSKMNQEQGSRWFRTMNTVHAGAFGHSLGGGVSVQAWATDQRIRAALNLDGWSFGGEVQKAKRRVEAELPEYPLLFLYEDGYQPELSNTPFVEDQATSEKMKAAWPRDELESKMDAWDHEHVRLLLQQYGGYFLKLKGANHGSFTDRPITSPLARFSGAGPIDAHHAHNIIRACAVQFFDQALKQKPSALLTGEQRDYPELLRGLPKAAEGETPT